MYYLTEVSHSAAAILSYRRAMRGVEAKYRFEKLIRTSGRRRLRTQKNKRRWR